MTHVETRLRRARAKIKASQTAMMAAKLDLLGAVREAKADGYTIGQLAAVMGITRSQAQKYVDQAREE